MTTYATMRTRIADELIDSRITTAQINNAIKSAIKHYEREPWWFDQKSNETFSTVANQEFYAAAAHADIPYIVRVDSMFVSSGSGSKSQVLPVSNGWMNDRQDGTVTGQPEKHSYYASKIRLWPIPSAVYTITFSYIYKQAELSADADTNSWTNECEELIRQAAKGDLCANIDIDEESAARYMALAERAYERLRIENLHREPQKELRTDWPFNRGYVDLTGAV